MLSSEPPLFGSGLTFLPSAGLSLGQHGAKTPCKRICWWLGSGRGVEMEAGREPRGRWGLWAVWGSMRSPCRGGCSR